MSSWWFQPISKILVKFNHFPKDRGENKKSLSCHHPDVLLPTRGLEMDPKMKVANFENETPLVGKIRIFMGI